MVTQATVTLVTVIGLGTVMDVAGIIADMVTTDTVVRATVMARASISVIEMRKYAVETIHPNVHKCTQNYSKIMNLFVGV